MGKKRDRTGITERISPTQTLDDVLGDFIANLDITEIKPVSNRTKKAVEQRTLDLLYILRELQSGQHPTAYEIRLLVETRDMISTETVLKVGDPKAHYAKLIEYATRLGYRRIDRGFKKKLRFSS